MQDQARGRMGARKRVDQGEMGTGWGGIQGLSKTVDGSWAGQATLGRVGWWETGWWERG